MSDITAFIRVDASPFMGLGHLMRCLAFANSMRSQGVRTVFICRDSQQSPKALVESEGFEIKLLPAPHKPVDVPSFSVPHAHWLGVGIPRDIEETREVISRERGSQNWLVVDHYAIDRSWESAVRSLVDRVLVIDDLADRDHDCDVLVDQNLYENFETRYDLRVSDHCQKLLGPRFAILRRQFVEARAQIRHRRGRVNRILVFFGGADPKNETGKALQALRTIPFANVQIDIVIGSLNPHRASIESIALEIPGARTHFNIKDMAALMVSADLYVGAGGTTTWERCCLGLPGVVVSIADNQVPLAKCMAKMGAVVDLGPSSDVTEEQIREALITLIAQPDQLTQIEINSTKMVDGLGCQRILDALAPVPR